MPKAAKKKAPKKKAPKKKQTKKPRASAEPKPVKLRLANLDIAKILEEMSLRLLIDDVPFKPQAYERAAYAIRGHERTLVDLYEEGGVKAINDVPTVGKGIAQRIEELLTTGKMTDLETLRKEAPVDIVGLTAIEGLGAKKIKALYDGLGVTNVAELAEAARQQRVRELAGFGAKSEEKILRHIELLEQTQGRQPIGEVLAQAHQIEAALAALPEVERASVAGSLRRFRETIGDIDILVASTQPGPVNDFFVALPQITEVYGRGETKTMVRLSTGLDADLRIVNPQSFGAALLYFTGSKQHNISLRIIANKLGCKLNEYGVIREADDSNIASKTEEEVYAALGLTFIPPEIREDQGEIEAAKAGELPELIAVGDIRGELQVHTDWSDGRSTLEQYARAARDRGLAYLAFADHGPDWGEGGLEPDQVRQQAAEIRKLDAELDGIRLLTGIEANIRGDGSLDLPDDVLAELDVVSAGIRHDFELARDAQTERLIAAMENPHVDLLVHPTARLLGRRRAIDVDMERVIEAAVRTGTVLDLDAQPFRLDLRDEHVRLAVDAGARLAITSDAHAVDQLSFVDDYGIGVARRGWARRTDVINTRPLDEMLSLLKRG